MVRVQVRVRVRVRVSVSVRVRVVRALEDIGLSEHWRTQGTIEENLEVFGLISGHGTRQHYITSRYNKAIGIT